MMRQFLLISLVLLLICVWFSDAKRRVARRINDSAAEATTRRSSALSLSDLPGYGEWQQWKLKFAKVYTSVEEEYQRFLTFRSNVKKIKRHNDKAAQGVFSWKMGLNQYSDMDSDEFAQMMHGFKRNYGDSLAKAHASTFLVPENVQIPGSVDWRSKGYVTAVKDQGSCGSCWAFSATGSLEGQHMRKYGKLTSLSEQNLVDCSGPYGNQGCSGGLMDQAFQYIKDNKGVDTERSYPYEAEDDVCRFNRSAVGASDTGFFDIPSGDEMKLQAAVATVGPISVAIDATGNFQHYSSGVFKDPTCTPDALDHGVLAVGYGTDPQDGDFWIVKNSWGSEHWGEQGYIRMARNHDNMCGIATQASYPQI